VLAAAHAQRDLNTTVDDRRGRAFSPNLENSRLVRDGLRRGVAAPPFSLPQIDGVEISLDHYRGTSVLLVFSDPFCKPCTALAFKLEQFHRANRCLSILMVSRGDVDANRAKIAETNLTFPVVLQQHWEISRAYGMFATPIAYVVDEAGVLASDVLVGADAILKAASRYRPRKKPRGKELALETER
jgi:peroxiredoxin Q/BCP